MKEQKINKVWLKWKLTEHSPNKILHDSAFVKSFIKENMDSLTVDCWDVISEHQFLSECFIRKFENNVCWETISIYQELSEVFMAEFQHKLDWNIITKKYAFYNKRFSDNFALMFYDKINWEIYHYNYSSKSKKYIKNILNKMNKEQQLYILLNYRDVWENVMKGDN